MLSTDIACVNNVYIYYEIKPGVTCYVYEIFLASYNFLSLSSLDIY